MIDDESCPYRMGPIRNLEQRSPNPPPRSHCLHPEQGQEVGPERPLSAARELEIISVEPLLQAGENAH